MQITLKVENLSVKLTEPPRQVLSSICAHVKPGQILGKFSCLVAIFVVHTRRPEIASKMAPLPSFGRPMLHHLAWRAGGSLFGR